MTTRSWDSVLVELEHIVELAEASLDAGREFDAEVLAPFQPPTDIGPLPEHQRQRAVKLLARQTDLEKRIVTHRDNVARDLGNTTRAEQAQSRTRQSRFGDNSAPQYIDHMA